MAKQIIKNTAHDLAVKILSVATETISPDEGIYDDVTPIGYAIKSLHWTQINDGVGGHIEIIRTNGSENIVVYELAGNGNINLVGLSDTLYSETHPVLVINSTLNSQHYTLLIHMTKII